MSARGADMRWPSGTYSVHKEHLLERKVGFSVTVGVLLQMLKRNIPLAAKREKEKKGEKWNLLISDPIQ